MVYSARLRIRDFWLSWALQHESRKIVIGLKTSYPQFFDGWWSFSVSNFQFWGIPGQIIVWGCHVFLNPAREGPCTRLKDLKVAGLPRLLEQSTWRLKCETLPRPLLARIQIKSKWEWQLIAGSCMRDVSNAWQGNLRLMSWCHFHKKMDLGNIGSKDVRMSQILLHAKEKHQLVSVLSRVNVCTQKTSALDVLCPNARFVNAKKVVKHLRKDYGTAPISGRIM